MDHERQEISPLRETLAALLSPYASPCREEAVAALASLDHGSVRPCARCPALAQGRHRTVFGAGNPLARIVFLGEAPGAAEDRRGLPFVGEEGALLEKMLGAAGIARDDVYVTHILKCRPPDSRRPLPHEVAACRPHLDLELQILKPEVLVCLGATAAHTLLDTVDSMGTLRGRDYAYRGIPVLVTHHPAFLLRTPEKKREAWEDLQRLLTFVNRGLPS